jgi:hypothetical protein
LPFHRKVSTIRRAVIRYALLEIAYVKSLLAWIIQGYLNYRLQHVFDL